MRYLVFGGHDYYPAGRAQDIKGRFEDLEAARELCVKLRTPGVLGTPSCDWVEIYDVLEGVTVG